MLTPTAALTTAIVGAIGAVSGYVAIKGGKEVMSALGQADLIPMSPVKGPPLPRGLNVSWPWR